MCSEPPLLRAISRKEDPSIVGASLGTGAPSQMPSGSGLPRESASQCFCGSALLCLGPGALVPFCGLAERPVFCLLSGQGSPLCSPGWEASAAASSCVDSSSLPTSSFPDFPHRKLSAAFQFLSSLSFFFFSVTIPLSKAQPKVSAGCRDAFKLS